jgi:class 3 adenylate cyclase
MVSLSDAGRRGVDVIDISADPAETRRAARHRLVRFGIPIASVALSVGAILGIVLHSHLSNRADALALSNDLVSSFEKRIQMEVKYFFAPASSATTALMAAAGETPLAASSRPVLELLAMQLLRDTPQISTIEVGAPNGDFLMVLRTPSGALDTKVIEHARGRSVTWYRRNPEGEIVKIDPDPSDPYDPRSRPWFASAVSAQGNIVWSDVYVFFTGRQPGITASIAIRDRSNSLVGVVGVDILIDRLSAFLADLKVGRTARKMIVDGNGRVIAYSDAAAITREDRGELRLLQVHELGDPVLTEAYDHFRVRGSGGSIVDIDTSRYIVLGMPVQPEAASDWSLLFVVPESDFVGFVTVNSRNTLLFSLGIVLPILGVAALLSHQGMVADRNARALRQRHAAMEAQSRAFEELGDAAAGFVRTSDDSVRRLTETVARGAGAARVGVWQLDATRTSITCVDCYDSSANGHTAGAEIHRDDCPELFEALLAGEELDVPAADADPRTAELHRLYLGPSGCRSLVSVPIVNGDEAAGFLWIEDAGSGDARRNPKDFARAVARMIGPRFAPVPRRAQATSREDELPLAAPENPMTPSGPALAASAGAMRATTLAEERTRRFFAQASQANRRDAQSVASAFSNVTVLVLKIHDDFAMAAGAEAAAGRAVLGRLVDSFHANCEQHEVQCVKILADQIVAAQGFDGDPRRAAAQLAHVALHLREQCASIFRRLGRQPEFGIGLDTGSVFGSSVGADDAIYNVWGGAVRTAATMAATARRGSIQATETTYDLLRDRFILQRRGAYVLPNVGDMSTYTIRGAL